MKRIITTTVINQSGVLNRVTGLLMKRQFNIESISVGHTEQPGMSKMTFVVNVEDERKIEQLLKQLQKQIDVIKVNDITDKAMVMRELALVKVATIPAVRSEIYSIVEPFRATVIDMSKSATTFQVTGDPEKIEAFIDLMKPYGIKELTRTGVSAFVRENQKVPTNHVSIL
ncbi:acetolactate synthase small subunit [Planococcus halotolerans]|uniref:Acetolactate synthase small subunit n=1 Tax=Planococcus halotolerans TaxID=2233542 RepID=A0A365KK91_9BACL|nr:acetolactate synthase small subunit [Planococcus halotolerans]QHJ69662.1 acetolactate synthase small subunit [Planococcus halotolerans]RAZ73553.1 acetolactate synthase small subunit [Planococcus halotolerans]